MCLVSSMTGKGRSIRGIDIGVPVPKQELQTLGYRVGVSDILLARIIIALCLYVAARVPSITQPRSDQRSSNFAILATAPPKRFAANDTTLLAASGA